MASIKYNEDDPEISYLDEAPKNETLSLFGAAAVFHMLCHHFAIAAL